MARITFNLTATCCLWKLRYPECGVYCNFKPKIRKCVWRNARDETKHRPATFWIHFVSQKHHFVVPFKFAPALTFSLSLSPQGPLLHRPSVRLLHVHGHDSRDDTRSRRVSVSHRKRTETYFLSSINAFICPRWDRLCSTWFWCSEFEPLSSAVSGCRSASELLHRTGDTLCYATVWHCTIWRCFQTSSCLFSFWIVNNPLQLSNTYVTWSNDLPQRLMVKIQYSSHPEKHAEKWNWEAQINCCHRNATFFFFFFFSTTA